MEMIPAQIGSRPARLWSDESEVGGSPPTFGRHPAKPGLMFGRTLVEIAPHWVRVTRVRPIGPSFPSPTRGIAGGSMRGSLNAGRIVVQPEHGSQRAPAVFFLRVARRAKRRL